MTAAPPVDRDSMETTPVFAWPCPLYGCPETNLENSISARALPTTPFMKRDAPRLRHSSRRHYTVLADRYPDQIHPHAPGMVDRHRARTGEIHNPRATMPEAMQEQLPRPTAERFPTPVRKTCRALQTTETSNSLPGRTLFNCPVRTTSHITHISHTSRCYHSTAHLGNNPSLKPPTTLRRRRRRPPSPAALPHRRAPP